MALERRPLDLISLNNIHLEKRVNSLLTVIVSMHGNIALTAPCCGFLIRTAPAASSWRTRHDPLVPEYVHQKDPLTNLPHAGYHDRHVRTAQCFSNLRASTENFLSASSGILIPAPPWAGVSAIPALPLGGINPRPFHAPLVRFL